MDTTTSPTPQDRLTASRRMVLGLAGSGAAVAALSACAAGGGSSSEGGKADGGGTKSDTNPFGVKDGSTVEVVIFKGGYGDQYGIDAGKAYEKLHKGTTAKVSGTVNIQPELQPRFIGGNPPDLFDNSGAQSLNAGALVSEKKLAPLDELMKAKAVDGGTVGDTLLPGATDPGTYSGKLYALNYVYTVYALWYSAKQFKDKGWTAPKTWDDVMSLGEKAKQAGLALFAWGGQNAADYFMEMAIGMAVKQGGKKVATTLDKLDAKAFEQPEIVQAYKAIEDAVKAGYFMKGGAGIKHTEAQTQWVQGKAVLYPSGSWIENEQRGVTPEGYEMTGTPVPLLASGSKMPLETIHGTAGEPFLVPAQGKNVAGGLEFLRVMLSKEQAKNFSKITSSPTIVKDTLPEDAFGSTALKSVNHMIKGAGENIIQWNFPDWYDTGKNFKPLWTSFLNGDITADQLREKPQGEFDKIRNDSSIQKFDVKS